MKNLYTTLLLLIAFNISVFAQKKHDTILKTPTNWRYEKIVLPLDFAPEMTYKGFEELRFAPGMFNTNAEKYFTYFFVIAIEDESKFSKRKTKKLLYQYYRGLCEAVAKSNLKRLVTL